MVKFVNTIHFDNQRVVICHLSQILLLSSLLSWPFLVPLLQSSVGLIAQGVGTHLYPTILPQVNDLTQQPLTSIGFPWTSMCTFAKGHKNVSPCAAFPGLPCVPLPRGTTMVQRCVSMCTTHRSSSSFKERLFRY